MAMRWVWFLTFFVFAVLFEVAGAGRVGMTLEVLACIIVPLPRRMLP